MWYRDGWAVMGTRTPIALLVGVGALVSIQTAEAAEVTRVLSARSLKDLDIDVSLAWQHDQSKASIKRESVQPTGTVLAKDLVYHQTRDTMQLRGEVGLVHDLSFFLVGSLVLADQRGLDFDRSGACATGNCIETLLRDGFLPGTQGTSWGIDAEQGGSRFAPSSQQVFRGPDRSGLEYLGLGLRWAAMNQARDHKKPTWTVGLETRLSVASDQRFDPGKPTANRGVGLGYHQIILSTMFSRRFGAYEPFMGGWFMQPALTSNSVYKNIGTGSFSSAQRRIGGELGIEGTVWENPAIHGRFALEASGRLEFRFEGLAQSELWEVLSGDSRCVGDATLCRAGIDVDSQGNAVPNSGVVRSPAYGLAGADAGLSAHIGRYARFRALFGMLFEETHFLTDAASGNSVYDIPGRRFRVEGQYAWHVLLDATATF
jgi:hypothetical protein